MENNPSSPTQMPKSMILPFEELYKTKLAPAIKQFKMVRRKLHFSIISAVSGVIILACGLFMLLNSMGYEDGGISKIWLLLFGLTILFLVISATKRKIDNDKKHLLLIYLLLNCAGFLLYQMLEDGTYSNYSSTLLLCVSMISMSVGLIVFFTSGVLDNYARQYRALVIRELVDNISIDIWYRPEYKVNKQAFKDSEIKNINSAEYRGCDLIEFEYGTQQFKLSNVQINTRHSSPMENFTSVFLVADINRKLKGITKIANRDEGKIKSVLKDMVSIDRLVMQTNYPELEKHFKVSATHLQEAEAFLTPDFVKRLLKFCKKIYFYSSPDFPMLFRLHLKGQKLYMSFMFNGGDGRLFPVPKLMEQPHYESSLRVSYDRLKVIMDFTKDLHLTNTEWANQEI